MGKRVSLKFKRHLVCQIQKGVGYQSISGQYKDKTGKHLGRSTYSDWKVNSEKILGAECRGKQYIRVKERSETELSFLEELMKKVKKAKKTVCYDDFADFCLELKSNEFKDCAEITSMILSKRRSRKFSLRSLHFLIESTLLTNKFFLI